MKLYYSPLACSLADHIALLEAGVPFERESVDLKTKRTASGADFNDVTRKGYVPALVLDSGEILTENIAVLDWLATQYPALGVPGKLGRTRVLEALAFISTEVHRNFKPMWHASSEAQKAQARATISRLLDLLADRPRGRLPVWRGAQRRGFLPVRDAVVGRAFRRRASPRNSQRCVSRWRAGRPCKRPCCTKGSSERTIDKHQRVATRKGLNCN